MNTPPTNSTDNDQRQPDRSPSGRPAEDAVVNVTGLTKRYGAIAAIENLSFSLKGGTVTGFLGPNGAGKTTTLRLLLGLAEPTSGAALVFGRRYAQLDEPSRLVGAVLESGDFHPGRSGRDHLRVLATAAGIDPGRVEMVLDLVGLGSAASRPVRSYSLGMRQRLGLAGGHSGCGRRGSPWNARMQACSCCSPPWWSSASTR